MLTVNVFVTLVPLTAAALRAGDSSFGMVPSLSVRSPPHASRKASDSTATRRPGCLTTVGSFGGLRAPRGYVGPSRRISPTGVRRGARQSQVRLHFTTATDMSGAAWAGSGRPVAITPVSQAVWQHSCPGRRGGELAPTMPGKGGPILDAGGEPAARSIPQGTARAVPVRP